MLMIKSELTVTITTCINGASDSFQRIHFREGLVAQRLRHYGALSCVLEAICSKADSNIVGAIGCIWKIANRYKRDLSRKLVNNIKAL